MINHRDQFIHLVDMRILLGIRSLNAEVDEFIELMDSLMQDHVNWLDTLRNCINERKKFTLTTDPHECKFGEWYDNILPTIEDAALKSLLLSFEKPHHDIHGIAAHAEKLLEDGKEIEAMNLIEETKNYELRKMVKLFDEVKKNYRSNHREIAVVLEHSNFQSALIVDEVVKITNLLWDNWRSIDQDMIGYIKSKYMLGIAKIPENESPVVILDVPSLFA